MYSRIIALFSPPLGTIKCNIRFCVQRIGWEDVYIAIITKNDINRSVVVAIQWRVLVIFMFPIIGYNIRVV